MAGAGHGKDSEVDPGIHITFSIILFLLLAFNLHQTCQTQVTKGLLLRNRLLVSLSVFVELVTNICLNIYFIGNVGAWFSLVVRTMMILWIFVLVAIGYPFLLNALAAAYRTKKKNQVHLPYWMERVWLVTIISFEVITVICYIMGFASLMLWPLKIIFMGSYVVCVIGSVISILALIDVRYSIFKATVVTGGTHSHMNTHMEATNTSTHPIDDPVTGITAQGGQYQEVHSRERNKDDRYSQSKRKLKIGRRVLNIMVVLIVLIIAGCVWNIYAYIAHSNFMKGKLGEETVIDNNLDYLLYTCVNIFVEITFTVWVYTTHTSLIPWVLCQKTAYETDTVCYTSCSRYLLKWSVQNEKRLTPAETVLSPAPGNSGDGLGVRGTLPLRDTKRPEARRTLETKTLAEWHTVDTKGVDHELPLHGDGDDEKGHNRKRSVEFGLKIVIYAFDGVLTVQDHRVFEHWKLSHLQSLTQQQLWTFFKSSERVDKLRDHFVIASSSSKLFVVSPDTCAKIENIMKRLGLIEFFDEEYQSETEKNTAKNSQILNISTQQLMSPKKPDSPRTGGGPSEEDLVHLKQMMSSRIVGSDHLTMANYESASTKVFILNLIKYGKFKNDEILYVDHDLNMIEHFKKINLCRTYHVQESGLSSQDLANIETKCDFFSDKRSPKF